MIKTIDENNLIQGSLHAWEVVIGMEVHAQISSQSKLFSGASTSFGAAPNENVALFDAAMPGMLPVINEECIRQAIRTGLGLKAQINHKSIFDRKNYFYPDLPHGYQISQFHYPIVGEGKVIVSIGPDIKGNFRDIEVRIERLHLEQDAGKSIHTQHDSMSRIDLNRAGVALMEIVSKPDLRSCEEAKSYLTKLRTILRYLETCDGNMEEGSLRADVNVSVRRPGDDFGTRCEIKNVNSIRFVGQAIEYEAQRQIAILEEGGKIEQETRLFDSESGTTRAMRSKEETQDYRFFPDPDLLPLEFDQAYVDSIIRDLPELPDEKKNRFLAMGLSVYDSSVLVSDKALADYFESVAEGRDAKLAANWVINDLMGNINKFGKAIEKSNISSSQLGEILDLIQEGTISGKIAKDLFEIIWEKGGSPRECVEKYNMKQITNVDFLTDIVDQIIKDNPEKVKQLSVKPGLLGWFIGDVMKKTEGKANPKTVDELIRSRLGIDMIE